MPSHVSDTSMIKTNVRLCITFKCSKINLPRQGPCTLLIAFPNC